MLVNSTDTHTYTYDDIYQIETVDYPGKTGFSPYEISFGLFYSF